MQGDIRTVTSVALAVACVVAVVAAAQGLESLSTDPEDLVDPGFDRVPAGEGSLEALRDEVVARAGSDDRRPEPSDSGDESESGTRGGGPTQAQPTAQDPTGAESAAQSEAAAEASGASQASQTTRSDDSGGGDGSQPPPTDRDWLAWLAVLGALAVAALAYRYAGRGGSDGGTGSAFDDADPDSEVERAWLALVRRVEADRADRPETRTPGEWATLAADSGLDVDAVATLTRTFETVRYGGSEETADHRRRVQHALDRIDGRLGTDGGETDRNRAAEASHEEEEEGMGHEEDETGHEEEGASHEEGEGEGANHEEEASHGKGKGPR